MKNKNVWIIIANSTNAYIYSISNKNYRFNLIKTLHHKESRLKNKDLVSDKPGHYARRCNKSRGIYEAPTNPKSLELIHFSKEICSFLEKGRTSKLYDGLIFVSEPNFYGFIKKSAHKNLVKLIKYYMPKDYLGTQERILQSKWLPEIYHKINLIFFSN